MLVLTFSVGPMRFALPLQRVRQIVPNVSLRSSAGMNNGIAGLLELGNTIVPVVDLGSRFRGEPCARCLSTRIVLVRTWHEAEEVVLGLIAENVTDLCSTDHDLTIDQSESEKVGLSGVTRVNGEIVQWLDVGSILSSDQRIRVYQEILAQAL